MVSAPEMWLAETPNANELLTMSPSSGIASTLDDPTPARVDSSERVTTSRGGQAHVAPNPERTRTGAAA